MNNIIVSVNPGLKNFLVWRNFIQSREGPATSLGNVNRSGNAKLEPGTLNFEHCEEAK